jgi:hypothetical protein
MKGLKVLFSLYNNVYGYLCLLFSLASLIVFCYVAITCEGGFWVSYFKAFAACIPTSIASLHFMGKSMEVYLKDDIQRDKRGIYSCSCGSGRTKYIDIATPHDDQKCSCGKPMDLKYSQKWRLCSHCNKDGWVTEGEVVCTSCSPLP